MKKWLPYIIVVVFAGWLIGSLRVPPEQGWAFAEFGRLPVVANGRTQPFDSLARNDLLQLREKQTANLEPWKSWYEKPKIISATEWVLGVMMKPEEADAWPVFRVDNPEVKSLLRLPADFDLAKRQDGKHYTWLQIQPKLADLKRESERASNVEASRRRPYDQALLKLWNGQLVYNRLKNTLGPAGAGEYDEAIKPYLEKIPRGGTEAFAAWQ